MSSSVLCLLITIIFSLPRVRGISPQVFNIVSNATCLEPDYTWMNNTEHQSPCLAVAYVIAACDGDTWTQPALPPGYSYDSPNGTTATPCYCSWSCYNLMMACTLCQSPAYASDLKTWPSFSQNCPSNYKDEVFPQGYVLANNASSIPYWATIDPTTWPSELFDITQAESYANQSHSDYFPSNLSPNSTSTSSSAGSSTNLGAIIGGTVGGVAGLFLVLIGGCFLYKRRQYRRLHYTNDGVAPILQTPLMSTHSRWPSDPSSIFPSTLMGATTQLSGMRPGMSVASPTPHSSFPATSPPLPTETVSFFTTGNAVVQHTRPIPMV
ncbi:hypothetical protein L210DRAFT_3072207 [Boletus edulis BED1]|uniref:Transmembrane protein n=1 Tax=Boletus edulis BED1 TaxID=1328754 RepID=A0AAD4G8Y8_BOLED|nr:hypothetical protein L210DRAFT_3072207 [Boletus edulis BED1]